MNAVAEAFARAGYADPRDRLRALMATALDQAPVNFTPGPERAADHARLKEVAMTALLKSPKNWDGAKDHFFKAVRGDAELLWALFEPYRLAAVQRIMSEVSQERHQREMRENPPQQRQVFAKEASISPAKTWERQKAAQAAVTKIVTLSLLDTFKVNGRPVGDLTAGEANAWAGSRERDAKFVRLLTQNLPADQPIRKFRTGDEAASLYEQAKD